MFFLFSILSTVGVVKAQGDCMAFFPTEEGTVFINKSYDASNNLLNTITYRVNDTYNYYSGTSMDMNFVISDARDNVIDNGTLTAQCTDGTFYLDMKTRALSPEIMNILGMNTELVGNFLDYPDTFNDDFAYSGDFEMDGGEFTVQSKTDKNDFVRVRMYNRNYEKNERITTPAGTFHASKITFNFEVTRNRESTIYNGVEWYAVGAGIVRSETYDKNGALQNYTVLTTLRKP